MSEKTKIPRETKVLIELDIEYAHKLLTALEKTRAYATNSEDDESILNMMEDFGNHQIRKALTAHQYTVKGRLYCSIDFSKLMTVLHEEIERVNFRNFRADCKYFVPVGASDVCFEFEPYCEHPKNNNQTHTSLIHLDPEYYKSITGGCDRKNCPVYKGD